MFVKNEENIIKIQKVERTFLKWKNHSQNAPFYEKSFFPPIKVLGSSNYHIAYA